MRSFLTDLLDLISPRACTICGCRLTAGEDCICTICNMHLPRTGYQKCKEDNPLAKLFWGRIPIERAGSLFFYLPHSDTSNILYSLKYHHHPEIGNQMGRLLAKEYAINGFFEGIDYIIPIPLARSRERKRGYNQSYEIAKGVSEATNIPVKDKVMKRMTFKRSQTRLNRWGRNENVEKAFEFIEDESINGKHILIIDDVVTTGATIIACVKELCKTNEVKISILTLAFAKS